MQVQKQNYNCKLIIANNKLNEMNLMQEIIANAQANKQRIVLPEGDEPRTLKAADQLLADNVADIILIGPAEKIKEMTAEFGLKNIGKARIIDPMNNPER